MLYWIYTTGDSEPMMHRFRFLTGNLLIQMLLFVCLAIAFLHCSKENHEQASQISLEKLSSSGQWLETGIRLEATPSLIGRSGGVFFAALSFRNSRLFSRESIVLNAKIPRFQSAHYLREGFVDGDLAGAHFQFERLEFTLLELRRDDHGGLLFGGTFIFGQFRIRLPLTQANEAESYRNVADHFGGDRVPKEWNLEEMVEGAIRQFYLEGKPIPKGRVQEAKILSWRISEDLRPLKVQESILWMRLSNPIQWMLVHIGRNDNSWPIWWEAWVEHSDPYWIQVFDHAPTYKEIESFLNANKWWSAYEGFELLDGEACSNAWKNVTGQEPNKTFEKLVIF
jgi:hypothetical protein